MITIFTFNGSTFFLQSFSFCYSGCDCGSIKRIESLLSNQLVYLILSGLCGSAKYIIECLTTSNSISGLIESNWIARLTIVVRVVERQDKTCISLYYNISWVCLLLMLILIKSTRAQTRARPGMIDVINYNSSSVVKSICNIDCWSNPDEINYTSFFSLSSFLTSKLMKLIKCGVASSRHHIIITHHNEVIWIWNLCNRWRVHATYHTTK